MTPEDIKALTEFHNWCLNNGISWSLHFEESCRTWYVATDSPAEVERAVGKSRSTISMAVESIRYFLTERGTK